MPFEISPYDRVSRWKAVTDEMAASLRLKTGRERLDMATGLWRFAFQLVTQSVRRRQQYQVEGGVHAWFASA